MTIIAIQLTMIAFLLLASAFVSGGETALTSLSRDDLARLKENYPARSSSFAFWQEFPNRVLAIILIGNNFFHIGIGVIAASLALNVAVLLGVDKRLMLVVIPGLVTVLIFLISEVFPKILARNNRQSFSLACVGVLVFLVKSFNSFISLITWISDTLIKLLGTRGLGDGVFLSSRELKNIFSANECRTTSKDGMQCIMDGHGLEMGLPTDTRRILRNILSFSDTTVGEIMTPRTELFAVNIQDKPENIIRSIYMQGFSRVPAYEKNIDNIVGIIYARDLLSAMRNKSLIFIQDILRPVKFVPAGSQVTELLRELCMSKNHLAVVVDEFGGTAGIVTIEDALEEIIGEIYDEYDDKIMAYIKESDSTWVVDAIEHLKKVNENLGLDLPVEKYENLASFVIALFGKLPEKGESKIYAGCLFEVVKADKKRVCKIRIQKI